MAKTFNSAAFRAERDAAFEKYIKEMPDSHKELQTCLLENWLGWADDHDLYKHEGENSSFIWSGHEDPFPDVLPKKAYTRVTYKDGDFPDDFKGAVAYVDRKQPVPRKWVFALDVAANKVWVDAGPIGPIDWNVVKVNLDAATESMFYTDPALKGIAYGRIITFSVERTRMLHMGFHEEY